MSDISFNPAVGQNVIGDANTAANRTQPQPNSTPAAPPAAPPASVPADQVQLSAAAQANAAAAAPTSDLSEEDANQTSLNLRQQLGAQPLSASARQNQSILSLLR